MQPTSYLAPKVLLYGQLNLAINIMICFILRPHFAFSGGGISNYGVIAVTIPFFSLGFLGVAVSIFLATRYLGGNNRTLKRLLYVLGGLFLAVLLTTYPYKLNASFDNLHQYASIILGLWEIVCGAWLVALKPRDLLSSLAFALTLLAGTITIITILGLVHILFIGETLAGASFGTLLVHGVRKLSRNIH